MKTQHFLILSIATFAVHAGPARWDCGETKTYFATNACGATYGGTWIVECTSGVTAQPTFTIPSCSLTDSVAPVITAAARAVNTTHCRPLTMCKDAVASCGGTGTRIGTCWDTCKGEPTLSTPTCTLPPPTITAGPSSVAVPETPPARKVNQACIDQPFLCAPAGW